MRYIDMLGLRCVLLRSGGYEAVICPQMGGNCLRLDVPALGVCLLRTPASPAAYHENPNVYGIPLLFPPNRITDGRYTAHGVAYDLPVNEAARGNHIHGFLSRTAFDVVDGGGDALTLSYDAPYSTFPHRIGVRIRYALDDTGLTHEVAVTNRSDAPMTFGVGLHTTFNAPFRLGGRAEALRLYVPGSDEWAIDPSRMVPTGARGGTPLQAALDAGEVVPSAQRLSALITRRDAPIRITDTESGYAIVYSLDSAYPFVMVYNANQSDSFLCCEPQSWATNAPNLPLPPEETGALPLQPGGTRLFKSRIHLAV